MGPSEALSAIRLSSDAGFSVTEVAVLGEPCFEQITVDFGKAVEMGLVRSRHYTGSNVTASTLLSSEDGETWSTLAELDPTANAVGLARDAHRQHVRHQAQAVELVELEGVAAGLGTGPVAQEALEISPEDSQGAQELNRAEIPEVWPRPRTCKPRSVEHHGYCPGTAT